MVSVSSHEVRLLLSVLYPPGVAPHWLALPLRAWPVNRPAPWGVSPDGSPLVFTRGSSAHKLSASSEPTGHAHRDSAQGRIAVRASTACSVSRHHAPQLRPAARSPDSTSHEVFCPFGAIRTGSPFCNVRAWRQVAVCSTPAAGLPSPQPFRLQGFAPSWRFSPPGTLPVCFARQAPLGFWALSVNGRNRCGPEGSLAADCTWFGRASSSALRVAQPLLHPRPHGWGSCFQLLQPRNTAGLSPKDVRSFCGSRMPVALASPPLTPNRRSSRGQHWAVASKPTLRQAEVRPRNANNRPATSSSSVGAGPPKRSQRRLCWHASLLPLGEPRHGWKARRTRQGASASLRILPTAEAARGARRVTGPAFTPQRAAICPRDDGTTSRYLRLSCINPVLPKRTRDRAGGCFGVRPRTSRRRSSRATPVELRCLSWSLATLPKQTRNRPGCRVGVQPRTSRGRSSHPKPSELQGAKLTSKK